MLAANLQNQDPTEPMDSDAMTTQLAQISLVEQQEEANSYLSDIADSVSGEDDTSVLSLVGETVSVVADTMEYTSSDSEDVSASIVFEDSSGSSTYYVLVTDSDGNTVDQYEVSSSDDYEFTIDGSSLTKGEEYTLTVGTVDSDGEFTEDDDAYVSLTGKATSISTWPETTVSVDGVATVSSDNIVSVTAA